MEGQVGLRMREIWSDENKFEKWLKVELAACEAWAKLDKISPASMINIRKAVIDFSKMKELEVVTHHEMTAFTGSLVSSVGEDSRFIHMGLTSSDVMDTALNLQVLEAFMLIEERLREIRFYSKDKVVREKFRVDLVRLHQAREVMSVGKFSGAVGTYAETSPLFEKLVCLKLGLNPDLASSQIVQRDRHAQCIVTLALMVSSLPHFFELGGAKYLVPQLHGFSIVSLENIPLWHERDLTHSSAERVMIPEAFKLTDYLLSACLEGGKVRS